MTLTVGSLFSGIGGLDLGLERAGMRIAWQVEHDPFCHTILAAHWPDVPRLGDIHACGAHNLAPVDVLAGGFPCQDISVAGAGAGLAGQHSSLWFQYLRIIRELRPPFVLVENVAALLFRGLDTVLGDLATSRYDAEWQCLPAATFGAPHRRDRLYLVAYPHRERRPDAQVLPCVFTDPHLQKVPGGREGWGATCRGTSGRIWIVPASGVCGVPDGPATQLDRDRLHALGNSVVPAVAEYVGRQIVAAHARKEVK